MQNQIKVRIATRDDAEEIAKFNVIYAKKITHKNLNLQTTKEGVHQVFSRFNNGFYIVAEIDGKIVGQTMITREWSDWNNGAFYCIQGIYTNHIENEDLIHDAIYEKAKSLAKEHEEVSGLRLYVDKNDKKSQKIYEELGMSLTPYLLYEESF